VTPPETGLAPGADPRRAVAYPPLWRAAAAALVVLGRGALLVILGLVLWANDPPVTPPILVELVVTFALLPWVAVRAVARAFTATVTVDATGLVIRRRGVRMEVAAAALALVRPWRLPLPGPGVAFRLTSGRALGLTLNLSDSASLLRSLADAGVAGAGGALAEPAVRYAAAARDAGPLRWSHLAGRYLVFGLLPAGVLFNAHQHIAYGGVLGEYRLLGLGHYLRTFTVYWLTTALYLLLYANVLRISAEVACLAAAYASPPSAAGTRRIAELAVRVLYYAGVPALLLLRFAPWE